MSKNNFNENSDTFAESPSETNVVPSHAVEIKSESAGTSTPSPQKGQAAPTSKEEGNAHLQYSPNE